MQSGCLQLFAYAHASALAIWLCRDRAGSGERWEKKIESKGAGMPLEAVNLRKYVGHVSPMNSAAGRKSNKKTRETQILFELTIRIWYDHRLDCKIPGTLNQQKPPNLPFGILAVSQSRGAA